MFRSKVKWFEQGEKPTKYFFNLEKTNYEKKLIREVKLENSETVTDEVQVRKEIEAFGDKSTQVSNCNNKFEDFIEGLDIPQLSKEEQEPLETELTLEELKAALASFANNKSPAEDGFTKEFYELFFYLLPLERST